MSVALVPIVFIVIVALAVLAMGIFVVHTQEVGIIERFGKFHKKAEPGLNIKIPVIDVLRARISLQVQQLTVTVETKTKDNVFITIPIAVQYQVLEEYAKDAFYSLTNPVQQIESYVQDSVRSSLAQMNLDDAFSSKDDIAQHVENSLSESMGKYGWRIVNTLVTDIQPDAKVAAAMNEINAASRLREAATNKAEANKITLVKAAEAEAEAKKLQGEGIAAQRAAIVKGLKSQVEMLADAGVGNPEVILMMTQYYDSMQAVSKNARNSVMFMPSNPGGFKNYADEIRESLLSVNMVGDDRENKTPRESTSVGSEENVEVNNSVSETTLPTGYPQQN